jgi:hypothetical protein
MVMSMDYADVIEARHSAVMALVAWRRSAMQRDELVRAAAAAGIAKTEIVTITGLARNTIYSILDRDAGRA